MDTLKDRLNLALKRTGYKARYLAEKAGISESSVSQWRSGRVTNMDLEKGRSLAKALGVNFEWLMYGIGEPDFTFEKTKDKDKDENSLTIKNLFKSNVLSLENDIPPEDGFIQIKEYKIDIGAGIAFEPTFEEVSDAMPATYRSDFFKRNHLNPANCKRLKVKGDSMEPLLMDGDHILVDFTPVTRLVDNRIYVLVCNDTLRVKRIIRPLTGGIILRSENPKYSDAFFSDEEAAQQIHILGRVVDRSGLIK